MLKPTQIILILILKLQTSKFHNQPIPNLHINDIRGISTNSMSIYGYVLFFIKIIAVDAERKSLNERDQAKQKKKKRKPP